MACARRFRAGALGAFVALLSGLVLVGPACADNTVPKREVLSDGGESGAYQRANEDSNGGGSPPSHFYLGDGGSTAVVHGPGEAVPGVGYVIPEPSGSSTAGSGSRSGGLGGPITASPNCSPSKVRYGYGNPGPGDDISGAPVVLTGPEAFLPIVEPYLVRLEAAGAEVLENPQNQALVRQAWASAMNTVGEVLAQHPEAFATFMKSADQLANRLQARFPQQYWPAIRQIANQIGHYILTEWLSHPIRFTSAPQPSGGALRAC